MICPSCSRDNPDTQKFCGECGAKLLQERICPSCQAKNPLANKFCGDCGTPMQGSAAPSPAVATKPQVPAAAPAPPAEAKTLAAAADRFRTGGERRQVAVLFADVVGFTAMSEKMDPERVTDIMNRCFERLEKTILRYEGTIDKYMGDCVLAVFGAPISHENDVERALRAAIEMRDAIKEVQPEGQAPLNLTIGITAGEVIAGQVGGSESKSYTVMGDTVNVAQRLQSAAKAGQIFVTAKVARLTQGIFEMNATEPIRVKGKSEPLEVYNVAGLRREQVSPFQIPPLIGRELEVGVLKGWLEQAITSKKGLLIGISGEAGMGKSRLKAELEQWLFANLPRCYEGRSARLGESASYSPFLGILAGMLELDGSAPKQEIRAALEQKAQGMNLSLLQVHALGHLFGLSFEEDAFERLDEKGRKTTTFLAIRQCILHFLEQGPCVLIFEDLQWVDALSGELLEFLFPLVENQALVVLCLYRPSASRGWEKHGFYQRIHLKELSTEATSALAEHHARTALPDYFKQIVWERTQGNPLFVEELVRTLREEFPDFAKRAESEIRAFIAERIPETVQGIIAARMDRMPPESKFLLQAASVVGRTVPLALLIKIIPPNMNVEEQLKAVMERGFLYERMGGKEREMVFKHTFIQDVAYRMLLQKHRQELHRGIAEAIEALYHDHMEEHYERLAWHYQEGGLSGLAAQRWSDAAKHAQAQFDNERAYQCFQSLLQAMEAMPLGEREQTQWLSLRASGLIGCAQMERLLGRYDKALEDVKTAAAVLERHADVSLQVRCFEIHAMVLYFMGRFSEAIEIANKGIETASAHGLELNVGNCRQALGACYYGLGNLAQASQELEQALRIYEKMHETSRMAAALSNLGVIHTDQSDYETGLARMSRALALFNELGDKLQLASCYNNLGSLYRYREEFEDAEEYFQQSMTLAQETSSMYGQMRNMLDIAEACLFQNRSDDAMPYLTKTHELATKHGNKVFLADTAVFLGVAHAQAGNRSAVSEIQEGMRMAESIPKPMDVLYGKFYLARLQKQWGDLDAARKLFQEAKELASSIRMKYFERCIDEALRELVPAA